MANLLDLIISANVSEPARVNGKTCAIMVHTSASSTITIERSLDGENFSLISDVSWTVDGTDEINLADLVEGQYLRVNSSAEMTICKILS